MMIQLLVSCFYTLLVKPWLRYVIGVSFSNTRVFKGLDQFIIVANHNSHFDTVAIMAALPASKRRNTRAVAASDYFGRSSLSRGMLKFFLNAVLIFRTPHHKGCSSIKVLDDNLKQGQSLVIFPEGTRGRPGVMENLKKGVAILLKENPTVPFVPVYLDGFGRVLPKDRWMIIPLICKIRFGTPLYPASHDITETLEEVRGAILKLKSKDERDRNAFERT